MAQPGIEPAGEGRYSPILAKRVLDIVVAAVAIVPAVSVILLAAGLIRATSKGPVFYVQVRLGRNAVPFRCYKLRTMFHDTPSIPTHEARADAVTPVGGFLRRTKLDELPQLWNVLKGEMAIVGPRPCLPEQHELIRHRERLGVFSTPQGITGLAQLRRIDMSQPALCAEADAEYLRRWSIGLDLSLIAQTLWRRHS